MIQRYNGIEKDDEGVYILLNDHLAFVDRDREEMQRRLRNKDFKGDPNQRGTRVVAFSGKWRRSDMVALTSMNEKAILKVAKNCNQEIGNILSVVPFTDKPLEEITRLIASCIRNAVKVERMRFESTIADVTNMFCECDSVNIAIRCGYCKMYHEIKRIIRAEVEGDV